MCLFLSQTFRSFMPSWCNEAIDANEAEDLLCASGPISVPASLKAMT